MIFAWPVDDKSPDTYDDGHCLDGAGFPIPNDASYAAALALYRQYYLKEWEEEPELDTEPVRFWLVNEYTHKAAMAIESGEWNAHDIRQIATRKRILKTGLLGELTPP